VRVVKGNEAQMARLPARPVLMRIAMLW
jgi:hypothetical protein